MDSESTSILLQVQDWLLRRVPPSSVRRVIPVSAGLGSDVGVVRKENQDRVVLARGHDSFGRPYVVVALADGIGGMRAGAQCAALAVSAVIDIVHERARSGVPPVEWLANAVRGAQSTVRSTYGSAGGATLVVLLITAEGACWSSVGDSRLYLFSHDYLYQISTDDTIAGQLGQRAETGIDQGRLLQYVGMEGALEFDVSGLSSTPENIAILTTDGVHFLGSDSNIFTEVIRHSPDVGTTARRLMELARWAGGPDNATVAVVSLDPALWESPPAYACLDIWDPYGEIRLPLVLREDKRAVISSPVAKRRQQTVSNEMPVQDVGVVTQSVKKDKNTKPEVKGDKGKSKKRKSRASRSTSAPQVQLEFSNKKS